MVKVVSYFMQTLKGIFEILGEEIRWNRHSDKQRLSDFADEHRGHRDEAVRSHAQHQHQRHLSNVSQNIFDLVKLKLLIYLFRLSHVGKNFLNF